MLKRKEIRTRIGKFLCKIGFQDVKIILQRLEEICNHANYLEQYAVSLKHYLESGITGYVGLRGMPSPKERMTHVKMIVTGLPDILRKCENMIDCLKLADWEID